MKVVPKKQWRYPLSLERTYAKMLVAHVQRMFKVINSFIPEIRDVILRYAVKLDADDDNTTVNAHIDILIDQLTRAAENHIAMLTVIRRMFDQVNRYNQQEWDAITKSVFGMPLRSNAMATMKQDADEDDIAQLKDIWVQQNLDLISSIDAETMQKIRDRMAERIIQNVDSASLTKYLIQDIKDIAGVEVNRAALIGSDQVGKLNGRLSQYRQQHAGIGEYKWSSCHDSRVRPAHAARDGHIYAWNNPPPDGHPGHPIRCRCVALPVIDLDKIGVQAKKNSFIPAGGNGIIREKLIANIMATGITCQAVNYPPKPIDVDMLSFDDEHINQERQHGVTEDEAKAYIRNAVVSLVRYNGRNDIYCSMYGWVYVLDNSIIKTVFTPKEFDENAKKVQEVLNRYEDTLSVDK